MACIVSLAAFASLVPLAASTVPFRPNITNTIKLSPPTTPSHGRQVVDAAYQSFSIEFSYMADYGGNDTYAPLVNPIVRLFIISGIQISSLGKWFRTCMISQGNIQYSAWVAAPRTRPYIIRIRPRRSLTPSILSPQTSRLNQCLARHGCNHSNSSLEAQNISMVNRSYQHIATSTISS